MSYSKAKQYKFDKDDRDEISVDDSYPYLEVSYSKNFSNNWIHLSMSSNITILLVKFQSSNVCVLFKLIK